MELIKKEPTIFIVSGKANSGKDTSCELINSYIKIKNMKSINLQFSSYIKMYVKNTLDCFENEVNDYKGFVYYEG